MSHEPALDVLILGASYGSLFATKLAVAGHNSCMVCLPAEEQLINREGTVIRLPVRGLDQPVELRSSRLAGSVSACSADSADPGNYDLIVLGMQEPQYAQPAVKALMQRIALSGKPCMSIMNMPPLPFLARLPGVDISKLEGAYTDASPWDNFTPQLMTLASPDPQAFRPPDEPVNVLQVGLPTNFKVARFESDHHTALLERMQSDIEAVRFPVGDQSVELPVKLKVHDSVHVPLAKWLMLVAGNYRCVLDDSIRPIAVAVHSDLELSRELYQWVGELCIACGADGADLVPFEKYAAAAKGLLKPSSAARALDGGAQQIERVDKIVQSLAAAKNKQHAELDAIVRRVDGWLERNRNTAAVPL